MSVGVRVRLLRGGLGVTGLLRFLLSCYVLHQRAAVVHQHQRAHLDSPAGSRPAGLHGSSGGGLGLVHEALLQSLQVPSQLLLSLGNDFPEIQEKRGKRGEKKVHLLNQEQ